MEGEGAWQALDVAFMSRIDIGEVRKLCGEATPGWVSFPEYERVRRRPELRLSRHQPVATACSTGA